MAASMKIAFFTTTYAPRINGAVRSVASFAESIRKLGHEVCVVAPAYPNHETSEDGVFRIKSHYLFFDPEDRLANPWLPSSRKLMKEIMGRRFDIIHTHTPFLLNIDAYLWARRQGCALVHTYHTLWETYGHYLKMIPPFYFNPLVRIISTHMCNRMDLIVVPSTQMRERLLSYRVRTPIAVNPTGIDLERYDRLDGSIFRKRHGIPADTRVLLFAGRIGKEKNIDFLLQVLKRVLEIEPNIIFLIAGDGPERSRLEELTARNRLSDYVRFLGYLSYEELVSCYSAADIFVFASVTETQGIVVGESMAAGTPVVALARMGVVDMMKDGKGGILVEPRIDDFSGAVVSLLRDHELYVRKQKEARERAKIWSNVSMAERMVAAYEELLARKRKTP
jgi:glycosyltransferase involved in cell wall biosynthesis